ncbi:MAG: serine protease, partial [Verrucomicrobiales bacterium]|nr:serine protease [Verrucomicrobiales bacterium]
TIDADVSTTTVSNVLTRLAAQTGWEIYLQPGTTNLASAKFKDLPESKALTFLLGGMNFSLVVQSNNITRLSVYHTEAQKATVRVLPKSLEKGPIPAERVALLKEGADAQKIADKVGALLVGNGTNAARLKFPTEEKALASETLLENSDGVATIDRNYYVDPPPQPQQTSASSSSTFDLQIKPVNSADQIIIGLIDSKVQDLPSQMKSFLLPSIDMAEGGNAGGDTPSHGTLMAETLLKGLAIADESTSSKVRIQPVDVYGASQTTTTYDVGQGILYAIQKGANIINLSLGGTDDSAYLRSVIEQASAKGVLFFAAAGNEPTTAPTYPAAYPSVIAVTAVNRDGSIASYANRGSFIDIAAPGSSIGVYQNRNWFVSGTSASSAYATGFAAGTADAGKSNEQVRSLILQALALKSSK